MTDGLGQSGIQYRCRCGAVSAFHRVARLMDAPGWGVTYVPIEVMQRVGTTKKERRVTQDVAVYLCPKCNPRNVTKPEQI